MVASWSGSNVLLANIYDLTGPGKLPRLSVPGVISLLVSAPSVLLDLNVAMLGCH